MRFGILLLLTSPSTPSFLPFTLHPFATAENVASATRTRFRCDRQQDNQGENGPIMKLGDCLQNSKITDYSNYKLEVHGYTRTFLGRQS